MSRRVRARICAPLIFVAFICLVVYERIVEGSHYHATIQ